MVMKNRFALLGGVVGLLIGLGFGMLINSVLLAVATVAVAGFAMGAVLDIQRNLPPDQIM